MRACGTVCVCVWLLFVFVFYVPATFVVVFVVVTAPPRGQPQAIFGRCISISGGWMLNLHKALAAAEASPHMTMQRATTLQSSLGVLAGVIAL